MSVMTSNTDPALSTTSQEDRRQHPSAVSVSSVITISAEIRETHWWEGRLDTSAQPLAPESRYRGIFEGSAGS